MFFDTNNRSECSGCTACMNVCPTAAIKMHEDEEGFLYPSVDNNACINCGLCRRVCGWEHPDYSNSQNPVVYAAILKDKAERTRSTSGGLFYSIAEWIINQGGVVYGAAFDKNLQLYHIGAETIEGLQRLRGSKYIQSNLDGVFKDVKKQLIANRWCYFTGTGCQIAGLKAYLGKEYPRLVTSDLVCHGVPSQKLFNEHISYMEKKYHDKIVDYKFRDYKRGGVCEACGFANRRVVINPSYELSPYLYGFMYQMTYRYSCYECKFAKMPRQGDITLADFWGVEHYFPSFDKKHGCSLVLLNSQKGQLIWDHIKAECYYEQSKVDDAARYNGNLVRPSTMPTNRRTLYNCINERGYADVAKKELRAPRYFRVLLWQKLLRNPLLQPFLHVYRWLKRSHG